MEEGTDEMASHGRVVGVPRLLDHAMRRAEVADVVTRLIAGDGLAAVTMRSVADEMRMSVAGLARHLSRDELLEMSALELGTALVERIVDCPVERRLAAFLPVECRAEPGEETTDPVWDADPFATFRPFGVLQTRVWLTWCNLAQSHSGVATAVEAVRQHQLAVMSSLTVASVPVGEVDGLLALVDGLRVATCRSIDPMPLSRARTTLATAFERTFVQPAGWGSA